MAVAHWAMERHRQQVVLCRGAVLTDQMPQERKKVEGKRKAKNIKGKKVVKDTFRMTPRIIQGIVEVRVCNIGVIGGIAGIAGIAGIGGIGGIGGIKGIGGIGTWIGIKGHGDAGLCLLFYALYTHSFLTYD